MTLGNVGRASYSEFAGKRKLLIVPYVTPTREDERLHEMIRKYWTDALAQVLKLEKSLGAVRHLFHEGSVGGGNDAVEIMEAGNPHGFAQLKAMLDRGVVLQPTEDVECLKETLDLHRCMSVVEVSHVVAERLSAWFEESRKSRYAAIAGNVDRYLKDDEVAILVISPDHEVKFASNIEVVYVVPPVLDTINRWMRETPIDKDAPPPMDQAHEDETPGWAKQ
jgi:hypothetical protein